MANAGLLRLFAGRERLTEQDLLAAASALKVGLRSTGPSRSLISSAGPATGATSG